MENLENFDFFDICILGKKGKEVRLDNFKTYAAVVMEELFKITQILRSFTCYKNNPFRRLRIKNCKNVEKETFDDVILKQCEITHKTEVGSW